MSESSISISFPGSEIQTEISIPGSKSESNRALILEFLSKGSISVRNISEADDTQYLQRYLKSISDNTSGTFDLGPNGTGLRFLTAALSITPGSWTLTGSERLMERPIEPLLHALENLGADIEYLLKPYSLPYRINGRDLSGGEIELDSSISSQFISALMLIAPLMRSPLIIRLKGKPVSRPYILMTGEMMKQTGIGVEINNEKIIVQSGLFMQSEILIDGDWSSASYWYETAALTQSSIRLRNLSNQSLQGDKKCSLIFDELFGVKTAFQKDHILIMTDQKKPRRKVHIDLEDTPDLSQAIAVTAAFSDIELTMTGLGTLRYKETDRINALINELGKCGADIRRKGESAVIINGVSTMPANADINTYKDHRMAMAFAPLACKGSKIKINDPMVVAKSYPGFWKDLAKAGYIIT